ncbi:two-component regulator propeller domain-containing protein [Marivirga sp.]|uniref:two-component regulator propeller domain-containing protein n=1 Tax=Marivirga sp. TaxID=2018662 RepID=UPI002D7F59EC|nr:two-component regulator propeller domain-containing protein [Marivirga sp.]HET8859199.1 two-component regulator propeller domain-containing protein [Marivirga sp.]
MRAIIRLLFILFPLIFSKYLVNAQTLGFPFYKYYSSQDYHGGIQNWKITQSKDGLLYVANNFGLLEFDGTNWNKYSLESGTKNRDVFVDTNGKIYIASQGDFGYYIPNEQGQLTFISLADSVPKSYRGFDEAWRIFKKNDQLLFCTFDEIFIYNLKGKLQKIVDPETDPDNFFMVNNQLYLNHSKRGLSIIENGKIQSTLNGGFFKEMTISGMIELNNNQILISTLKNGIFIKNDGRITIWNGKIQKTFKTAYINQILRLKSGEIAVGTQNEGLYILDSKGNIKINLTKGKGIENRTVLSVYEDIQGNLWLGHNNGISSIALNSPFKHLNEQSGLPGTGYDALLKNDTLYLGTNNGLYFKNIYSQNNTYSKVENTSGQVYNIQNINNSIIMGHHAGTFEIDHGKAKSIADIPGTWTFLDLKKYPNLILQGNYKGLALFEKSASGLKFIRKLDGFEESSRVMEEDEDGNIWMTHGYKGVYKIKLKEDLNSVETTYYSEKSGLPSKVLINVWNLNNQLIFSTENGLYEYNKETDQFIPSNFLAPYFEGNTQFVSFTEDPIGNIYFVSMTETGVLEKVSNGKYKKHTAVFNQLKNVLNDDLHNIIALEANKVLFAAKEGFIYFDNTQQKLQDISFNVIFTKIRISNSRDSILTYGRKFQDGTVSFEQSDNTLKIPYRENSIHFEYSAPFMNGQFQNEYQYWLENSEKSYSDWSIRSSKEYTNLPAGEYNFHVKAKNIYGQTSEVSTFEFTILPPWYKTNLAYGFYLFIGLVLSIIIYYAFEFRFKKKTEIITEEKEKEITRIDSELKTSEQKFENLKNEKLKSEIQLKNKELATSTMHLINKNSFINSVKNHLNNIAKRSKNQEVKHEISRVVQNIDKNIAADNDWEHFSIHFDKVHGDFIKRWQSNYPDLSPQEMKLSAYLRMNLSTKEIANLLNISVRGVEIARYRLRKKLTMERSDNLQEFILKY